MSKSFSKQERLNRPADYQTVFRSAQRFSDQRFLILAKYHGHGKARLGLAIAKKKLARAVDRNQVKRVVRESFRGAKQSLYGWDIIVLLQKPPQRLNNKQMFASLSKHWQSLKQCKKSSSTS